MGAFSNFDQAQKRLSAARTAFNIASARTRPFREQSDEALKAVLKEFAEAGLFPNIDTNQHERLSTHDEAIAKDSIWFRSNDPGLLTTDDHDAIAVVDAIIEAAIKKKIPVTRTESGCQTLEVSKHVKDREKCPEILLLALAEFAHSKGRDELASSAKSAAKELQKSAAALQQLE